MTACHAWAARPRPDRFVLPFAKPKAALTPQAILETVVDNPADPTPRAVFADVLSDQGDPRGEFISAQLMLERADLPPDDRQRMTQRCHALLAEHEPEWLGGAAVARLVKAHWRRGFVDRLTVIDDRVLLEAPALFRSHPITSLTVQQLRNVEMQRLATLGALRHLESLSFDFAPQAGRRLGSREVSALLESRVLRGLTHLALRHQTIGDLGALSLAAKVGATFPKLEALALVDCEMTAKGIGACAGTPWFAALLELDLSSNHTGPPGAEALGASTKPTALRKLHFNRAGLGDRGAIAIASSRRLGALEALSLTHNRIGPTGTTALLERKELKALDLRANAISQSLEDEVARRLKSTTP